MNAHFTALQCVPSASHQKGGEKEENLSNDSRDDHFVAPVMQGRWRLKWREEIFTFQQKKKQSYNFCV